MARTEGSLERRSVSVRALITGILVAAALVFIFQNTSSHRVHFLGWSWSMPTWIWLLIIFAVGVIVGAVVPRLRKRRGGRDTGSGR